MSGDFELCPKCKQGHLYPEGRAGVDLEGKGDFRETASMRDLICDHCGRRQKNAELKEYGGPATEIVSGVVTKADPRRQTDSFKVPFQLLVKSPHPKPGPSLAYPYSIWYDMNYARLSALASLQYLLLLPTYHTAFHYHHV